MKQNVTFYIFERAFSDLRPNSFNYRGLRALYDYLIDYENDAGEELELDVIAFCCEYIEYSDVFEALEENCDKDEIDEMFQGIENQEDKAEEAMEWFENQTTVIRTGGLLAPIVIQQY